MAPAGFVHASGSKALCLSTLLLSALVMSDSRASAPIPARALVAQLGFARPLELVLGMGLLYGYRHVERMMGTHYFLSFVTASTTLAMMAQWAAAHVGWAAAPGPFAPLFSLLVIYYAHVPAVPLSKADGAWTLSQKAPMYAASACLVALQGWHSLLPACLGLASGLVVKSVAVLFPDVVASFFSQYIDSWFASAAAPQGAGPRAARAARRGGNGGEAVAPSLFGTPPAAAINRRPTNATPPLPPPPPLVQAEPSEADIESLTAMGFTRDVAVQALRSNRNDVNEAANALFNNASS